MTLEEIAKEIMTDAGRGILDEKKIVNHLDAMYKRGAADMAFAIVKAWAELGPRVQ